jgi:hypothetical protein
MIPQETIQKWQGIWKEFLDMAYYRKNIKSEIFIQSHDFWDLYTWCRDEPDFDKLTLDYMWERYSFYRDSNNKRIEPVSVPELQHMYIPNLLFETIGIHTFMKTCFPNCEVTFWEDTQG